MFGSCRFCNQPTDKWQDFCNECAASDPSPRLRVITGGKRVRERLGKKKWRRAVDDVVSRLKAALVADYVVLGGGNAKKLQPLPEGARLGDNGHAFIGGRRLWDETE